MASVVLFIGSQVAKRDRGHQLSWHLAAVLGITTWYGIAATWLAQGIFDGRQTIAGVIILYAIFLFIIFEDLMRQALNDHHNAASGERAAVEGD